MGNKGRITRIAAPLLGSPFTFASLIEGKGDRRRTDRKRHLGADDEVVNG